MAVSCSQDHILVLSKQYTSCHWSSLGSLNYEEELTVCFVKEPNPTEESALSLHLCRRLTEKNAAFTIIFGLTITVCK